MDTFKVDNMNNGSQLFSKKGTSKGGAHKFFVDTKYNVYEVNV